MQFHKYLQDRKRIHNRQCDELNPTLTEVSESHKKAKANLKQT